MELTVYFFFNLSLLIVILFLGVLWAEKSKRFWSHQAIFISLLIISLMLCFIFTYRIEGSNVVFDLRKIPFIVGSLYMGFGPFLAAFIMLVRGFLGIDYGFWMTVLYYGGLAILFWRISSWFLKQSPKQRVLFSVGVTFLFSFAQTFTMGIWHLPHSSTEVWFAYLVIQPIGVGIISYIIEEIIMTIQLRQRTMKSKRLEAVERMGAAISHEIRNPLTAAIGFVQLLQNDSISKENYTQYLSIIKNELKSAERVIQEYLNFSNPEIKSMEPLLLQEELEQVVQLLQPLAKRNSVKIVSMFSPGEEIEGDKQKFHQCLVNIMKNAIEAMPKGGILTVETESTQTTVSILIKDTGSGMTLEQVTRLGEPYYSTKGSKGTGLGITVVYSIVRAMNGTIHVESKIGEGTTFKFTFPSLSPIFLEPETKETEKELVMS
ncbi:sensor histidine kinase [Psychrobacillus psychrodurans]|uniref:sensor histidine kinase n=1 Tax=Psychrobacillus psychrodurans TaxID=126157 RepID=UPI0008E2A841|nr:HAMP domain-containing sensor histidine kinase [Psychrobacillus psychrodurans]MCZ8542406.1 HAMP domain-containing histidine kinase [Psychrobacillus psychrodurans]SFN21984.1 two-component system, sporulation sensor kinase B [Psychrobacillus psychrodurans]